MLSFPLGKEAVLPRQLLTFLPGKEAIQPQQAVSQALSFPLGKEAFLPLILLWQLLTFLPGKEAILPRQLLTFPRVKEAVLPLILLWQLLTFLPVKEAILPQQLLTFPRVKGSSSSQAIAHLPSSEGSNSPPAIAHLPPSEGSNSPLASSLPHTTAHLPTGEGSSTPRPLGKVTVLPRWVNQAIKPGQSGKTLGIPPGIGHPRLPRRIALSPRKTSLPPPSRLPQGSSNEEPNPKWVINLSNKPLTPAQGSILAKGPNFVVTTRQPPNLEYITAIEAVCTKLSQQDAKELRADINRVLRSSHPPNLT